jgi:hypothetical protein
MNFEKLTFKEKDNLINNMKMENMRLKNEND